MVVGTVLGAGTSYYLYKVRNGKVSLTLRNSPV